MDLHRSILLVDDEARSTRCLAQLLRNDGFDVEFAGDGAAAIARLAHQLPDFLVTDYAIPHANGIVVSMFARSRNPDLPIVFLTAFPEPCRAALLNPPAIVLTKPLVYDDLLRILGPAQPPHTRRAA